MKKHRYYEFCKLKISLDLISKDNESVLDKRENQKPKTLKMDELCALKPKKATSCRTQREEEKKLYVSLR